MIYFFLGAAVSLIVTLVGGLQDLWTVNHQDLGYHWFGWFAFSLLPGVIVGTLAHLFTHPYKAPPFGPFASLITAGILIFIGCLVAGVFDEPNSSYEARPPINWENVFFGCCIATVIAAFFIIEAWHFLRRRKAAKS